MGKFETNRIDVRGDGKVVLYQRPDVKNPKWKARISVRGSSGYKRFSTKETDQKAAERVILDRCEKLYFMVKRGGFLQGKPFRVVYEEWCQSADILSSNRIPDYLQQMVRKEEIVVLSFFRSKPIDDITEGDLEEMMSSYISNSTRASHLPPFVQQELRWAICLDL